jgi:hypothetical protein
MEKNINTTETKTEKALEEAKIKAEQVNLEEIYHRLEEIIN